MSTTLSKSRLSRHEVSSCIPSTECRLTQCCCRHPYLSTSLSLNTLPSSTRQAEWGKGGGGKRSGRRSSIGLGRFTASCCPRFWSLYGFRCGTRILHAYLSRPAASPCRLAGDLLRFLVRSPERLPLFPKIRCRLLKTAYRFFQWRRGRKNIILQGEMQWKSFCNEITNPQKAFLFLLVPCRVPTG